MNVVFISPHFPPQYWHFAAALKREGATVLGIGDAPAHELRPELQQQLAAWYQVPDMERYDDMLRAIGYLVHRHGRIDRLDSLNEHWLELEARLREDFNVPGQRPADTARNRSKSAMREVFRAAGVPSSEGERLRGRDHALELARRYGYPLVLKPDVGVGAARTNKVSNEQELRAALEQPHDGCVLERFERGPLASFDGIADREGRIVYSVSHAFSAGIMDIVNERRDMFYYSRREIPPKLEEYGRRVVQGFGIRERFFHIEFFETGDGDFRALEVNVRPPGGFTTDMMNFTSDVDVYELWAKALTGKDLSAFRYERRFHVAHVGRRHHRRYAHTHEEIARRLGPGLLYDREMPRALAGAMGDHVYMFRDPDEQATKEHIAFILEHE